MNVKNKTDNIDMSIVQFVLTNAESPVPLSLKMAGFFYNAYILNFANEALSATLDAICHSGTGLSALVRG